ncbi:hypothetical protein [Gordonia sp. CPCC 205333]|uniref:hypothetical protein n=1 Tax=Gordonia sp. CPCC 205333 TaxID=3140790 RepID=UPI003AF353D9
MRVADAHAFITTVERLTGTRPKTLDAICQALIAVDAVTVETPATLGDLADGGQLTAANAEKLITSAAQHQLDVGSVKAEATAGLLRRWNTVFRDGTAAQEVTELIAPIWAEHWEALRAARELDIGPETTADQVLDTGTSEHLDAWQALPVHRAALDQILSMVADLVEFGAVPLGNPIHFDSRPRAYAVAAFFLADDALGRHDELVRVLADRSRYATERAGLWLRLTSVAGIQFNSARAARVTMAAAIADRTASAQHHYDATHS